VWSVTDARDMYSIGEFSRITGLSVKALRLYHERGLLMPARVDEATGYRYYAADGLDRARAIAQLKAMTFSLDEIQTILAGCEDDADIVSYLERKAEQIARKLGDLARIKKSIASVVTHEKEALDMLKENRFEVEEKSVHDLLIASIRWKGRYDQSGSYFGKLYKAMGRHVSGKGMGLYHDDGYREEDADIETCVPIRKGKEADGITIRKLPGGRCMSLMHKGPYTDIGRSYARLIDYAKENGYAVNAPSREIYVKGPGMFFKGNPKNYLTEIQFMLG